MHPSGYTGTEAFKGPEPGSNGMILDPDGRVSVAGHARRNVWRMESSTRKHKSRFWPTPIKARSSIAPMTWSTSPTVRYTSQILPTAYPPSRTIDPAKGVAGQLGVYRVPGARHQKPGTEPSRDQLQLVIKDLPRPNGICFSPDEKYLYIADSGKKIWMRLSGAALRRDRSRDGAIVFRCLA